MATVVARRRKTGTFYSVVEYLPPATDQAEGRHVWHSCGSGKEKRAFAHRWAAAINELNLRRKAGFSDEDAPRFSEWTIATLRERDLDNARALGQNIPTREGRWAVWLEQLGADTPIESVTTPVIHAVIQKRLKAGIRRGTINRDLGVLSAAFKLARRLSDESGYVRNPFEGIERLPETDAKRARALTQKETARLVKAARATDSWERATIVELLLLTGSRTSEIFGLRLAQVRGALLLMPPHKKGTGRVIALTGRLGDLIREALARVSPAETWLFGGTGREGRRMGMRKWWTEVTKAAKLPGLHLHDLRHTAATTFAESGATIPGIQRLLGHRTAKMAAEVYTHVHPEVVAPVVYSGQTAGKRKLRRGGRKGR